MSRWDPGPLAYTKANSSQSTQREILRKRPKNNNKAWIKLSEAILSILGDKFICSTLLARLMEEFPASKMHLQPAIWITGKFPSRRMSRLTLVAKSGVDIG